MPPPASASPSGDVIRAPVEVTSTTNARVKALLALRRRRARQESRLMLVEGYEELVLTAQRVDRRVDQPA